MNKLILSGFTENYSVLSWTFGSQFKLNV